jgi:hypothetical protein
VRWNRSYREATANDFFVTHFFSVLFSLLSQSVEALATKSGKD